MGTFSRPQLQLLMLEQPQSSSVAPANVLSLPEGVSSRTLKAPLDISSTMKSSPDGAKARPVIVPGNEGTGNDRSRKCQSSGGYENYQAKLNSILRKFVLILYCRFNKHKSNLNVRDE